MTSRVEQFRTRDITATAAAPTVLSHPDQAGHASSWALTLATASPVVVIAASSAEELQAWLAAAAESVVEAQRAARLPRHADGLPCERAAVVRDCPRSHSYTVADVRPTALVAVPQPGDFVRYLSHGKLDGPFLVTAMRGRTEDHLVLEGPAGLFEHYFDAGFNTFPA